MPIRSIGDGCPVPHFPTDTISLAHGEGGPLMRRLIHQRIAARLSVAAHHQHADAAVLGKIDGDIVMTTDSYVVTPLFFPGGDIGSLAVHGTINDLAMAGAQPRYLTVALILEEGLPISDLDRILVSLASSAEAAKVQIVAGDTKVVPRGAADGMFITTTGIGVRPAKVAVGIEKIAVGDAIVVSGPIADHGFAVLAARESLGFDPMPVSDSQPLHHAVAALLRDLGDDLHAMRDATRGGVAAVLHEWAEATGHALWIDEQHIPLRPESRGVSELLGIDPLFVANEGTFVAAVAAERLRDTLAILATHSAASPAHLGAVRQRVHSPVIIRRRLGVEQPLDEPIAAMLPRIC